MYLIFSPFPSVIYLLFSKLSVPFSPLFPPFLLLPFSALPPSHHHHHHIFVYFGSCHTQLSHTLYTDITVAIGMNLTVTFIES